MEKQNSELRAHTNRLTAIEEEQKAEIGKQQSEIAALKTANERLTAISSEIEGLKKAVINMQTKDNDAIHQVVLNHSLQKTVNALQVKAGTQPNAYDK